MSHQCCYLSFPGAKNILTEIFKFSKAHCMQFVIFKKIQRLLGNYFIGISVDILSYDSSIGHTSLILLNS